MPRSTTRSTAEEVIHQPRITAVGGVVCIELGTRASVICREVQDIINHHREVFTRIAVTPATVDIGNLPWNAAVGGVVRPQFATCGSIICREIERIADQEFHEDSREALARTAVNVIHSPFRMIGSVVRPQFCARILIACIEIDGIANESLHVSPRH